MTRPPPAAPRIALALAGGGPLGAIYEIGALCALEDGVGGLALNRLQHYVGVSAGGFVAASLANGFTPRDLCTAFLAEQPDADTVFDPAWLLQPAWGEFGRRARRLPGLLATAAWRSIGRPHAMLRMLEQLAPAVPAGVCDSEEVHRRLARIFSQPGRSNDFRALAARLTLVATDLDTGEPVAFGEPGWDAIPVSRAVQASAALPGLFPPVRIGGRDYVDGALQKTLHASVALREGVDLLLCLNPLVPFRAAGAGAGATPIADGGLPAVLGQTFRSLIHSRLGLALKQYERSFPGTDVVLLEPEAHDAALTRANAFSYRNRRQLAEHAYQQTRQQLLAQQTVLGLMLARHGLALRTNVLEDARRTLVPAATPARPRLGATLARLDGVLDDLDQRLRRA